jgi:hypothetical protein
MKTRKFVFNWKSFLLGTVLCAVLVVFIGSKAAGPQTGTVERVLQRPANLNDVWEKNTAMEERLIRIEKTTNRLQEQMDYLLKNMEKMWRENRK